jgi:hypothetical protein
VIGGWRIARATEFEAPRWVQRGVFCLAGMFLMLFQSDRVLAKSARSRFFT